MAAVQLHDVRKRYGTTQVIHGVSVDIADGEFIVIVGPSGCGKSTLLRMVAGLEKITAGTISIGGRVVNEVEPADRNIAMVFQNYALYPHMSVYNNMAYGLKIAGFSKSEIAARIDKTAAMLQLGDYLDRRPSALSGGQRQRVAMGRALVREPAAFLLDEPLSNLDAKLRVQMRLEIRQMQRAVNTTALYVTHDQVEAMTLADRLIVMNDGVAEQIDSPLAVYQRPATTFVAGFIGSPAMNLWPVSATGPDRGVQLQPETDNAAMTPVPLGADLIHPDCAHCLLGVRPEHLMPVQASDADFALTVLATELLGADTLAYGSIGPVSSAAVAPSLRAGAQSIVRLPGTTVTEPGDLVYLRIDRSAVHWFEARSGQRLEGAAKD